MIAMLEFVLYYCILFPILLSLVMWLIFAVIGICISGCTRIKKKFTTKK